jgi:hypothetical protein
MEKGGWISLIKGEGEFLREIESSPVNRIQQSLDTSLCSATNAVAAISGKWLYSLQYMYSSSVFLEKL